MRHSKLGARAFGLALVGALALVAFSAGVAQAENLTDRGKAGTLQVLGSSTGLEGIEGTGGGVGASKFLVKGRSLTIECGIVHVVTDLHSNGAILITRIHLACKALNSAKETEEISGCNIAHEKTITEKALLLPRKHEGKPYVLGEQETGQLFTTIEFESGKGCALPLKNEVKGTFGAQASEGEVVKQTLTFSEAIQKLLGDKLLFGTFEAFEDASLTIELTGAHKGCTFGIV